MVPHSDVFLAFILVEVLHLDDLHYERLVFGLWHLAHGFNGVAGKLRRRVFGSVHFRGNLSLKMKAAARLKVAQNSTG